MEDPTCPCLPRSFPISIYTLSERAGSWEIRPRISFVARNEPRLCSERGRLECIERLEPGAVQDIEALVESPVLPAREAIGIGCAEGGVAQVLIEEVHVAPAHLSPRSCR